MFVADASVWVSRFLPTDSYHAQSRRWIEERVLRSERVVIPIIAFAEIAGAVARRTGRPLDGRKAAEFVGSLAISHPIALDESLGRLSARVAADLLLKGSDAVYVAVARRLDLPLVTWDKEQLDRGSVIVQTFTPTNV